MVNILDWHVCGGAFCSPQTFSDNMQSTLSRERCYREDGNMPLRRERRYLEDRNKPLSRERCYLEGGMMPLRRERCYYEIRKRQLFVLYNKNRRLWHRKH